MAGDVTKDNFKRLETRVDVLDREVEGEKIVTRHILEQTRRNSDDLAAIKTRLDRVEGKVDGVSEEVRGLKTSIDGLVRKLPKIVSEAVRQVSPTGRSKQ